VIFSPSRRSREALAPNSIAEAIAARRGGTRAFVDLTRTNPTTADLPYDTAAIRSALADPAVLRYEPSSFGSASARATVAEVWRGRGIAVDPEHVVLTASTSDAYSFLFKLLCDPGDQVLVPRPSYPLFEHLCRLEGVVPVTYPLEYDGAWHMDTQALSARVTPLTRAVVLVSPNNPTGSFVSRDELAKIAELGLPIVSDEVFGAYGIGKGPSRARTALELTDGLVFALDGLSKYAALPQMKLAWITASGDRAAVGEALPALELIADTFLSPSAPAQCALPALIEGTKETREAIRARLAHNLSTLARIAAGTAVSPLHTEGGWSTVVRLPATRGEDDWVLGLLEERDVLVQPGWFYDFFEEPFVVLGMLTPEADFEAGVRRLVDYVERTA
jgi:aspartate/methionine/tyrosine aminotransferase